jgi:hypothetical protein
MPRGRVEGEAGDRLGPRYGSQYSQTHRPAAGRASIRQEYGDHGLWVLPKQLFLETVKVGGQAMPRFQYVGGHT